MIINIEKIDDVIKVLESDRLVFMYINTYSNQNDLIKLLLTELHDTEIGSVCDILFVDSYTYADNLTAIFKGLDIPMAGMVLGTILVKEKEMLGYIDCENTTKMVYRNLFQESLEYLIEK